MKYNPFRGTGIALITPFKADGSIDAEALTNIVNHVIDHGADFLVVLGTTSEAPTLNTDEKNLVISTILKAHYLVHVSVLCGEHYYADSTALAAQEPAHLRAVHTGHHYIQYGDIEISVFFIKDPEGILAAVYIYDIVACSFKIYDHEITDDVLIFADEYSFHID